MKAAVFFPGIGYHCDKPLLYYSRKLAQECGYEETIALSYTYDGGNIRGNEEKMQQAFESLYEQAEKSLSAIDFDKYDEILFVAKSVGTIIASAYAEKHSIRCRQILYTPLKYTYNFAHREAIAFIGTSGVLFLKYRLFPRNSRCQCIFMKTQTIHWKQQIHWKT